CFIPPMLRLFFGKTIVPFLMLHSHSQVEFQTIVKCYTDFNNAYGVQNFPPFKDYFDPGSFHQLRTNMLDTDGIVAKPRIMQYGSALTECLKPVADCIEDSTFEQAPLLADSTKEDGHRYNFDRLMTAYECTEPGYSYQMRHFYCITHLKKDANQQAKLDKCDDDMDAATENNRLDPQNCKAYQENTECYRQTYADYCESDEAGEFYCNAVAQEYLIWNPDCVFDCKKH
ncbi:hypothetical protein PMAYCL1PPCAC_06419, partial [Pristionchus mayeri]